MNGVVGRIRKEILEILPAFIFFFIMFSILAVTKALTLKAYGITIDTPAVALIGAFLVAKAIFIANKIPFINLYPRKSLIWNVVLKTLVFGFITFLFLIIEELIRQSSKHGSLAAGYEHLKTGVIWPAFLAREIWVMTLLFLYCAITEFIHVVGYDKVREIFFGAKKSV